MNDWTAGVPFGLAGLVWLLRFALTRRRSERAAPVESTASLLDRAEMFALQGAFAHCAELVLPLVEGTRAGRDFRPADAVRAHLLLAECEMGSERPDDARQRLGRAAELAAKLPKGPEAVRLGRLDRFLRTMITPRGTRDDRSGGDALIDELAPAAELDPTLAIRLARLAIASAEGEIAEGAWPRARLRFEQAYRCGERVPVEGDPGATTPQRERAEMLGALARSRASYAAGEIGAVLVSLGRHDEATEWLDRAIATCEGARLEPGRIALARARIVRAMHEAVDPVLGSEPRRRLLLAAHAGVADSTWPAARALTARAEIQLGVLAAQDGDVAGARERLDAAARGLSGLRLPGVAELVAESHLLLGHVLEDHGDLDDARLAYRRALDAGREDADPDARRLAAVAGCHLHRLLHHADRADEALELLDPLEALAPTLAPGARSLVAAMVARCRGQQQFRDGDHAAADRSLARAMALVDSASGPEAIDLARQIAAERGNLALAEENATVAEEHFRRAIDAVGGTRPPAIEQAERAEIRLRLAQALFRQDRPLEARPELERAFEAGRDSGRSTGRAVAAAAALLLGDDPESTLADRRGWYESAARFGKLSGTERGRQVEAVVADRLRELAE